MKKVFLEISQNSRENTSARVSFLIKGSGTGVFCEFYEIFKNTSGQLLLQLHKFYRC